MRLLIFFVLVLAVSFISSSSTAENPASLGWGVLDGFLAPCRVIVNWFWSASAIYSQPNTGSGYNTGFVTGMLGFFAFFILPAALHSKPAKTSSEKDTA